MSSFAFAFYDLGLPTIGCFVDLHVGVLPNFGDDFYDGLLIC